MTPTEVADILRQFNEWQRGDGPLDYVPRGLIKAIDAAIEMIERTWYKQGSAEVVEKMRQRWEKSPNALSSADAKRSAGM